MNRSRQYPSLISPCGRWGAYLLNLPASAHVSENDEAALLRTLQVGLCPLQLCLIRPGRVRSWTTSAAFPVAFLKDFQMYLTQWC